MAEWSLARRGLLASAVIAIAVGFGPAAAPAALLDANCPGPADGFIGSLGNNRKAETFTVVHSGTLIQAQTEINKTNVGGNFQLQILDTDGTGTPINGTLGTAVIVDASVPSGITTLVGNFSPGVPVQAGHRLALVVTRPGGMPFEVRIRTTDPCPGNLFFANTQTDTFNPEPPGYELIYQTMVNPTNAFTVGKVKGKTVTLNLPGPGAIKVAQAGGATSGAVAAKSKKLLKTSKATAAAGGAVKVKLKLTKDGQSLLDQNGKLKVKTAITFTPTGGEPNTLGQKLKLK